MNAQDKQHLESLIHSARKTVRDIGKVAQLADPFYALGSRWRSQIMEAYDSACAHLTQLDPAGAAEFIHSTYGPAFRQTGDAQGLANVPDGIYSRPAKEAK